MRTLELVGPACDGGTSTLMAQRQTEEAPCDKGLLCFIDAVGKPPILAQ
jgi:hypothetical protein